MWTYFLTALIALIIINCFIKKKNIMLTAVILFVTTLLVSVIVNVYRLDTLPTKTITYASSLKKFNIGQDTTYVRYDTLRTDTGIFFSVKSVNKLEKHDSTKIIPRMGVILVNKDSTISFYYDGDETTKITPTTQLVIGDSMKYITKREIYVGDKWTSDLSLPYKNTTYQLMRNISTTGKKTK